MKFSALALSGTICFAGCVKPSIEGQFLRGEDKLSVKKLNYDQPSCRGSTLTAYYNHDSVVLIKLWIGTSQRSIFRDFYFDHNKLKYVNQRTLFLLDDQAYELKNPRPESETKFYFDNEKLVRTEGSKSPINASQEALISEATIYFNIATKEKGIQQIGTPNRPPAS